MSRPRKPSLQVLQDLRFERLQWRVQRAAWVVMLLTLVLGALGLFGGGLLSHAQAGSPQLAIEYERFVRRDSPIELRVSLEQPHAKDGVLRLAVALDYLQTLHIEQILPRPLRVIGSGDELIFEFAMAANATALHISFEGTASTTGYHRAAFRNVEMKAPPVQFSQFTYP